MYREHRQRKEMAATTQFLNTPAATSIDEARALIRQCAEPCMAGELVKESIFRASRRLEMPLSRARDIWYGDARRIDADEMDRLRQEALNSELEVGIESLNRLATLPLLRFHPLLDQVASVARRLGSVIDEICDSRSDTIP